MVTYEEFLKENKEIEKLTSLELGEKKDISLSEKTFKGQIASNFEEYFDVAEKCETLKTIHLDIIQNEEYAQSVKEFIKRCNSQVKITNMGIDGSTKEEFFLGEEIIDSVVSEMNPEWSVKQKLVFVHYKMGELVSYLADYNSLKVPPPDARVGNARGIWKSLVDRKSVCNGITAIEQCILSRVGVETERLNSGPHTYMLTKTEEGNIITDATWDLPWTYFGARPHFFGLTYEEICQADKREDGTSTESHKLKKKPENVISVSDKELRDLCQSVGILSENRQFDCKIYSIAKELFEKKHSQTKSYQFFEKIQQEIPDKLTHVSEAQTMFGWALQWCECAKLNDFKSQIMYEKEDETFENPNLVFAIKEDGGIVNYRIDPNQQRIFKQTTQELEESYQLHPNNPAASLWEEFVHQPQLETISELQEYSIGD